MKRPEWLFLLILIVGALCCFSMGCEDEGLKAEAEPSEPPPFAVVESDYINGGVSCWISRVRHTATGREWIVVSNNCGTAIVPFGEAPPK